MDYTNINDPAGVKALLDQLRTSQAWQDLEDELEPTVSSSNNNNSHNVVALPSLSSESEPEPDPAISDHISSLLIRLQPGGCAGPSSATNSWTSDPELPQREAHANAQHGRKASCLISVAKSSTTIDHRALNFNQALPIIARLSENSAFMERLEKLQEDQTRLERAMWERRAEIIKSQEDRVRVALAKSSIIGADFNQSDAKILENLFKEELTAFDREQVLPAWDALVAKQQGVLEAFGVPCMFPTTKSTDREKQQRVVQVLEGLSEPKYPEINP